ALPFAAAGFAALTFTYLLRYVDDPAATMQELVRVVTPGGVIASREFHVPGTRWARAAWRPYTRYVMPLVGSVVSPAWASTARFPTSTSGTSRGPCSPSSARSVWVRTPSMS